jgi:molecular chaperone DnaJ
MTDDFYQLLGLTPDTATPEDIKANYRKLAMRWHPDKNGGSKQATDMFAKINEAYATLSNPARKAEYDRKHNFSDSAFDFRPFFSFTFSNAPRTRWEPWPGEDISIALELDFLQSLRGVTDHPIHITREVDCPKCKGRCADKVTPCERCGGTGKVVDPRTMLPQACPFCKGVGAHMVNPCNACSGLGRILVQEDLRINIPCGVNNGSILRTALAGNGGHLGGQDGDLYSTIRIKNDSPYHREQQTLILKMKVPPETLILGGEVEVPLPLGGKQKQIIPPCSSNNWSFAIPGHGMPKVGDFNHRGMLLVVLEADFPSKLTDEEERALKAYAEIRKKVKHPGSNPAGGGQEGCEQR